MATWAIKTPEDYAAAHKAIQDRLNRIAEGGKGAMTTATTDVVLDALGRSVERAPVREGPLRGSGYAEVNGITVATGNEDGSITVRGAAAPPEGDVIKAEIGFTEKYAFVQHEHVEFKHPMGGQAKYLESVVVENEQRYLNHLAESAKKGLRGEDV